MLGKTNAAELGYGGVGWNQVAPVTNNPWDMSKTSGGSSAGSAAAIATGMGAMTIGSDGGGSIRSPASFNNIFGIKPSFGRIPLYPGCRDERYPGVSSWETLESLGPITRTVEDAALLLSVCSGPDMRDRHSLPTADFDWLSAARQAFKGKKIAYSPDFGFDAVDSEVRALTEKAAKVFVDDLGCDVVEATPAFPVFGDAFWAMVMRDSDLVGLRRLLDKGLLHAPLLVDGLRRSWTAEDFSDANKIRQATVNVMWRFMQKYDLFLTPVTPAPAFDHGLHGFSTINGKAVTRADLPPFTAVFNWTGQPAASVPAGFTRSGLPVGLQIIGRHLCDALVLSAAAAYEAVQPWQDQWPYVVARLETD